MTEDESKYCEALKVENVELKEQLKKAVAYLYVFETVGCLTCHREIVARDLRKMLGVEVE